MAAAFPLCWLALWTCGEIFVASTLVRDLLNGGRLENPFLFLWLAGWTFAGLMVGQWVRAIVRRPGIERLTLPEDQLHYETDRPDARDPDEISLSVVQPPRSRRPPPVMSRLEIEEVLLDRHGGRQRLRLRRTEGTVELGKRLREPEREWLADVLRAWLGPVDGQAKQPESEVGSPPPAGEPACVDAATDLLAGLPEPPPNTWIRAELADGGRRRLWWMPFPERRVNWTRWGSLVRTVVVLVGWCLPAMLISGLWLMVAVHIFRGPGAGGMRMVFHGPAGTQLFVLVVLTPFLILLALFGFAQLANLWGLLRRFRPESLTLRTSGLHYDPGHFVARKHANFGRPRDLPRSELGRIHLEHVDGRQRLTIDHGVERIEVGACLREPEREWLAEALCRWAGRANTDRRDAM